MHDIRRMIDMKKSGQIRKYRDIPPALQETVDLLGYVYSEASEIGMEQFEEFDEKIYDIFRELNKVAEEFQQAVLYAEDIRHEPLGE